MITEMDLRIQCLVIDTTDPRGLAGFWESALGWRRTHDEDDEVVVEPPKGSPEDGVAPDLLFGRVPEVKAAVNGPGQGAGQPDRLSGRRASGGRSGSLEEKPQLSVAGAASAASSLALVGHDRAEQLWVAHLGVDRAVLGLLAEVVAVRHVAQLPLAGRGERPVRIELPWRGRRRDLAARPSGPYAPAPVRPRCGSPGDPLASSSGCSCSAYWWPGRPSAGSAGRPARRWSG